MAQYVKMTWQDETLGVQEANVPMKAITDTINTNIAEMQQQIQELNDAIADMEGSTVTLQKAYPVGSLFFSTVNTNPNSILGFGTWERWGNGKTIVSVDENDDNFNTVEKTGGAKSVSLSHTHTTSGHILTTSEIPSHNHTITVNSNGSHNHTIASSTGTHTHSISSSGNHTHTTASSGTHRHSVGVDKDAYYSAAGGESFSVHYNKNDNPSGAQDYVNCGSNGAHTHSIASSGAHTHSIGSSGGHSHTVGSSGSHSHTATSASTGSGNSHSHGATGSALSTTSVLQPYITCYIWKRTA